MRRLRLQPHPVETHNPTEDGSELTNVEVIYPRLEAQAVDHSVPEGIRELFTEGLRCLNIGAYRAAGGVLRAAVEMMCKDKKIEGKDLYQRINNLGRLNTVTRELIEDLHEARVLGNDSLHDALEYSEEEVRDVAQLVEEALIVIYVQPAQRLALRAKRKARRQAHRQQLTAAKSVPAIEG